MKNDKENTSPENRVITHIKRLVSEGRIQLGGRLPAERTLAEQVGVSRLHVRNAIKKLETYGITQTRPQSGTVLCSIHMQALDNLFSDVMQIGDYDFASLVNVRVLLEKEAARLAALNRDEEDLRELDKAVRRFEKSIETEGRQATDFNLHQAIARASHNPVIASLLLIITPDTLRYYQKYRLCSVPREVVMKEHRALVEAIRRQDVEAAESALTKHLSGMQALASGQ